MDRERSETMRYSAERRRCNGGTHFEVIDSTERFATKAEARSAARERWGLDRGRDAIGTDLGTGNHTIEVYDWERHCYVGHVARV
jgi:hypothetical protein